MLLIVLTGIMTSLVALYLYITRNFDYWKKKGVKELLVPKLIFGNAASVIFAKETPQDFIQKLYNIAEDEKMIGFYVLDKPYLMLRDPELIKNVCIKDFNNFCNKLLGVSDKDAMGKSSLLTTTNPPWKHIRNKLSPFFTPKNLKTMIDRMTIIGKDFETYLDSLNLDDKIAKPVEIKETAARLMTDIIGLNAYNVRFNSLTDPEAEFRKYGKTIFKCSYKRYLQMLSIFFVPALRSYTNAKLFGEQGSEFLKHTFGNIINNRMNSRNENGDIIDLLIKIKNEQENQDFNGYKLNDDAIIAQASIMFTGGFETSSTTLTYALYHIAESLEVQNKLKNEIRSGLQENSGKLSYELLTTMPYLNMVVTETLRMYPILAWIDRIPENNYKFPGTNITIDKGIPIILPMRAMHMDPKYFTNPEKFDPERFSDVSKITQNSYFPFGEGPRSCIGIKLGFLQVKFAIFQVLSKYEITLCKDKPIVITNDPFTVFTQLPGEVYINFKKCSL